MKTFVIDASALLAAWLPEEPYQDQADALLDRYQDGQLRLCAPVLLADEILNGLYIAVRGKGGRTSRLTQQEALEVWKLFQSLHISLEETNHLASRILELAFAYRRPSTYDTTYIALAEHLKTKLITADERLINAMPDRWVLPLWEFQRS
ncbi:MAG: type II toxin-antitoxin system VapC family toxin [Candidatus Bipolaricaulota bacterium]|nr:type II toxin-antitoxin system VapC family toxin [Candidatus Bipolaricaulota bacterium]